VSATTPRAAALISGDGAAPVAGVARRGRTRKEGRMKKLLAGIAVIAVVIVAAAAIAPFVIPADAYKARLVAAVKESTGRDLKIAGPVSFRILPSIALSASQVSFSNAPGMAPAQMAQIKSLEVRLRLLPLLTGTVAVDSFVLDNPSITLAVDKNGRPNWEFAGAAEPAKPAPAPAAPGAESAGAVAQLARLHLASLELRNGSVSYRDERDGKRWEVSGIDMNFAMSGLDRPLSANGAAMWNGQTVNVKLAIGRPGAFVGGKPTTVNLAVSAPAVAFSFSGNGVGAPKRKLVGDLSLSTPSVRGLAKWLGQPLAPGNGFGSASIKGRVGIEGDVYTFDQATVALDSINGHGGIQFDDGGATPYVKGSLVLGGVDLNPYLAAAPGGAAPAPPPAGPGARPAAAGAGWSTAPIDAAPLKRLNADFFLGVDSIRYHNLTIGKSSLILHLKNGALTTDLTQMALYKGTGQGRVTFDGSGAVPVLRQSFVLKGVDMQPLLHDAGDFNLLSGLGSLDMAVEGRGTSQREIVSSLSGNGSFHLDKGALKGVNVVAMMKNAASALSMGLIGGANSTDFTTMSGTFTIAKGILRNSDLQMTSPELPMTGAGTVDLPQRRVNYRLTPKIAGAVAVPIDITGPWDDLSYRPDLGAILSKPKKEIQKLLPQEFKSLFGK
jgi:AsmA protein